MSTSRLIYMRSSTMDRRYLQPEPLITGPVTAPRSVFAAPMVRRSSGGPKFVERMATGGRGALTYGYALNSPLYFVDRDGRIPDSNYDRIYEWPRNPSPSTYTSSTDWLCWGQCMQETFSGRAGDATAAACVAGGLASTKGMTWAAIYTGASVGGSAGNMSVGAGVGAGFITTLQSAGIAAAVVSSGVAMACSMACTK